MSCILDYAIAQDVIERGSILVGALIVLLIGLEVLIDGPIRSVVMRARDAGPYAAVAVIALACDAVPLELYHRAASANRMFFFDHYPKTEIVLVVPVIVAISVALRYVFGTNVPRSRAIRVGMGSIVVLAGACMAVVMLLVLHMAITSCLLIPPHQASLG